nr:metallophosphoesterase [Acutalibacter muris]
MREFTVAVLADVHGNYLALKACLDYARARKIEKYVFLGDYITDHTYPQRVMELLYEAAGRYDCRFVRGNREDYMISYRANGGKEADGSVWRDGSCQGALLYCYENLTDRDIDWFEGLPVYGSWQIGSAPPIAFCHGSPYKTKDQIYSVEALEKLAQLPERILLKGHNHRFFSFWHKGLRAVCAGSVGNPIYCRTRAGVVEVTPLAKVAQMLLMHYEGGRWVPEYVTVPYDWEQTIKNLELSGLTKRAPVWAAMLRHNVLTGTDPFGRVPQRAVELYRLDTGIKAAGWAGVPEEYWVMAAKEYKIELVPENLW